MFVSAANWHILHSAPRNSQFQQHIEELVDVLEWKDKPDALFTSRLMSYRRLQDAVITINCAGASMCEVEKVEAAVRHAAEVHGNHATIQLIRINTNEMVSSSNQEAAGSAVSNALEWTWCYDYFKLLLFTCVLESNIWKFLYISVWWIEPGCLYHSDR